MLHEFEQQVREADPARFHFIQAGGLEMKKPDWLVKPLIECDAVVEFFGDPESGKTFGGIDVGCCVSLGKDFHGHKTRQGAVLYIAGEGRGGIK